MSSKDEIHVDDVGTLFRMTVKDGDDIVDLSSASTKELRFRKPSGVNMNRAASFTTDGTDGIIEYSIQEDELDEVGEWRLQCYVELPGGGWSSNVYRFNVYPNV